MQPYYRATDVVLYRGDVRECLAALPEGFVQCVVTSPPYYGLRDYKTEPQMWGGSAECEHGWGGERHRAVGNAPSHATTLAGGLGIRDSAAAPSQGAFCRLCGAWRGHLGLEPTPLMYIEHLTEIFEGVRRVLRDDGVCYLNIGDSYSGSGRGPQGASGVGNATERQGFVARGASAGSKNKDLLLIPERLAIALQDAGWWVRSRICWAKRSAMPECLLGSHKVYAKSDGAIRVLTLEDLVAEGPPYPLILTPTGWRPIRNAWRVVKQEAISFEAAKVSKIVCSREHLWPVSHDRRRISTDELRTEDLRDRGYQDYLLHYAIDEWMDGTLGELEGLLLDYDLGWLLGLYAAEGGFGDERGHRCKLTFSSGEMRLAERVEAIVAKDFHVPMSLRAVKNYIQIRFSDKKWHRLALSVVQGDCTTKQFSLGIVLNAPRAFRQGLWDGYIAGDGSDRPAGTTATSASPALAETAAILASSIGIITSKRVNIMHDARTGKDYTGYQIWTPYLTRRQRKKGTKARQITIRNKQERHGLYHMVDLDVEGELFLIEDGICTHNSVKDRPTSAWEHIWMLTKSAKYYWDAEAAKEPLAGKPTKRRNSGGGKGNPAERQVSGGANAWGSDPSGRNQRNFWLLGPEPFPGAHFATFVTEIPRRAILAGTSEYGACSACNAPWIRVAERNRPSPKFDGSEHEANAAERGLTGSSSRRIYELGHKSPEDKSAGYTTLGWKAGCECGASVVPCTVLDPFLGSGTTALVARQLGRRVIGIDLNAEYLDMAVRRLSG